MCAGLPPGGRAVAVRPGDRRDRLRRVGRGMRGRDRPDGKPVVAGSTTGASAAVCEVGSLRSRARSPSSAARNSSASAKRSSGFFASARRTIASSDGEIDGTSELGGRGGSERWRSAIATTDSPSNGTVPGEQLVEHHPDRVEVAARAHRKALCLLGREVARGAHDRAGLGDLRGARLRDPEVGDLDAALLVDDHVVRLQVAVHDAAAVRESRGTQDLLGELDRVVRGQRRLLADDRVQRTAVEVLHRDVVGAAPLAAVVDADDVRVRERRGARGLAAEALDELLVQREALVQQLDRHAAAELDVVGAVDLGHAARADARDDAVAVVDQRPGRDLKRGHACAPSSAWSTCRAIGAAIEPPKPTWCAIVTAIAICGFATGA